MRMALGAQGNQVTWLFLRRSFVHLAVGLTLGIAGAFGVGVLFSRTQLLVQTTAATRSRSAALHCCWRWSPSPPASGPRVAQRDSIRSWRCAATEVEGRA